jgi:hypothetical protein
MTVSQAEDILGRKRVFGVFSIISAIFSIILLIESLLTPSPSSPVQLLSFVASNAGIYVLAAVLILPWMVFSVLFVLGLGVLLRSKDSAIAQAATFLSAGGLLLLSYGNYTGITSLLTVATTSGAPNQAAAVYQFTISANLLYALTDPGLMAWGLGQLLFGWLAWRSSVMPNAYSLLGFLGGVSGILASLATPPLGPVFALATGLLLMRK